MLSCTQTVPFLLPPIHPQATHIFDGLDDWPTHVAYLSGGEAKICAPVAEVPSLKDAPRLLEWVEGYVVLNGLGAGWATVPGRVVMLHLTKWCLVYWPFASHPIACLLLTIHQPPSRRLLRADAATEPEAKPPVLEADSVTPWSRPWNNGYASGTLHSTIK